MSMKMNGGEIVASPEAKAARNAYARAWRQRNPDKVKAAAERYWAKRARQMTQKERKEGEENAQNENTDRSCHSDSNGGPSDSVD